MKTLFLKELREMRTFFLVIVALMALTLVIRCAVPQRILLGYGACAMMLFATLFPGLALLFAGTVPFSGEFTQGTAEFIASLPMSARRVFWTKYLAGLAVFLVLLSLALLFTVLAESLALVPRPHFTLPWPDLSAVAVAVAAWLFSYPVMALSAILFRRPLLAILGFIPVLLLSVLFLAPVLVVLILVSPLPATITWVVFSVLTVTFFALSSQHVWTGAVAKRGSTARVFGKAFGVLTLCAWGAYGIGWGVTEVIARRVTAKARAQGLPLTVAEVVPPPVADERNGALPLQEAFTLGHELWAQNKERWSDIPYNASIPISEFTPGQKESARRLLETPDFHRYFDLLEEGVARPSCRFPVEDVIGFGAPIQYQERLGTAARLSAARSRLAADRGDMAEALRWVRVALRLGDTVADEPTHVSQFVKGTTGATAVNVMGELLDLTRPSVADIRTLVPLLEREPMNLDSALKGDMVGFCSSFRTRTDNSLLLYALYVEKPQSLRGIWAARGLWILQPVLNCEYARCVAVYSILIPLSREPYWRVKSDVIQVDRELAKSRREPHFVAMARIDSGNSASPAPAVEEPRGRWRILRQEVGDLVRGPFEHPFLLRQMFTSLGLGSFDYQYFQLHARYSAVLDTARLGLLLRLYKMDNGAYPDALSALVPKYIGQLPPDPFTGKDFIHRREGQGFIVYSVGVNEKDEGGKRVTEGPRPRADDVSFVLKR